MCSSAVFEYAELCFLTIVLPLKLVKPDSNLFFDGRLYMACALFSLVMAFVFHCSFIIKQKGSQLQQLTKISGKWIRVPEPKNKLQVQEWQAQVSYP